MLDEQKENDIEHTNDDNIEDIEVSEIEEQGVEAIKRIKAKLNNSEKERLKLLEDFQRVKADFLNSKKRLEEQTTRTIEKEINEFIMKLLPLCDSFQLAMSNKKEWDAVDESWRKGIENIHNQLMSVLRQYDVEVIDPLGQTFDPKLHEAMSKSSTDANADTDTVSQVLQQGYKRNGELIRPAKVMLSN